jgi:hypothetical protein
MAKFSIAFNIPSGSFFDIDTDGDTEAYLDPDRLITASSSSFDGVAAKKNIDTYMETVLSCYATSDSGSKKRLLSVPREINATHLGLSAHASRGTGTSFKILDDYLQGNIARSTQGSVLRRNSKILVVLVTRFGKDRFSDLITNFILPQLCDFTLSVCKENGITELDSFPINYFNPNTKDWASKDVLLPYDDHHDPIILVPQKILVTEYDFSIDDYVKRYLLEIRQGEIEEATGHSVSKKQLYKDEVQPFGKNAQKKYALDDLQKSPRHLEDYLAKKERHSASRSNPNNL